MAPFDASFLNVFSAANSALPMWLAGAFAALFIMLCVLVLRRPAGGGTFASLALVLIGGFAVVAYLAQSARQERASERRAIEARGAELSARALTPGSILPCLDGSAGDAIETACERAVFARPENAAAAVAFVAARIALLVDGIDYAGRGDPDFAARMAGLRRSVELDRYGIAAHVLNLRYGCTVDQCQVFGLLNDTGTIKANLKIAAFHGYVARYEPVWNEPDAPVDKPAAPAVSVAPDAQAPRAPVSSRYNPPSAASIPPVSIMNNEPKVKPAEEASEGDAPTAPTAKLPVPPKRPQSQATAPPAR